MYPREEIDAVRAAVDMVALVSRHTSLKRSGTRHVGLCPFHSEKTPSFTVNDQEKFYHCFGCKESGDCFSFVQKTENLDFTEALESLADTVGIRLSKTASPQNSSKKKALAALADACAWFHQQLFEPDARAARDYLRGRGYNSKLAKRWSLGWAPGSWNDPKAGLRGALSHSQEIMLEAGLLKRTEEGQLRDVQQARIIFPIRDHKGDVIAFGGRALPGRDKAPKYINSPETFLYKKSRVLYGLDKAKSEIVRLGGVIITEGYTDVIGLHEMGFGNAVATCGTALTRDHLEYVRRFSANITLAFDPDSSGQAAAERIHQWEMDLELQVKVADLSEHGDPGDVSQKYMQLEEQLEQHHNTAEVEHKLDELRKIFTHTKEYLRFRIDRVVGGDIETVNAHTITSPEQQMDLALKAARIISQHPSRDLMDKYFLETSERFVVPQERLRDELNRLDRLAGAGGQSANMAAEVAASLGDWRHNEDQALLLLYHFSEHVPEYVDEWLFEHPPYREVCRTLLEYENLEDIAAGAPREIYREVSRLGAMEPPQDWPEGKDEPAESLIAHLLWCKAIRLSEDLNMRLRSVAKSAQSSQGVPEEMAQLFEKQKRFKLALDNVRREYHTLESAQEHLLPLLEEARDLAGKQPAEAASA